MAPPICAEGGHGLFFPAFETEHTWNNNLRACLYAAVLIYLFLGVNIAADKFMSSIEHITSKKVRIKCKEGRHVTVKVWNATVANLTLMALGSSAPEILLSVVEILRNKFIFGELGASTIVGSAAFNLFVIIAVCIVAIPSPETRQIKENTVFAITVVFSLLAYFWMVVVVQMVSPDEIEIWEGVATFAFFPVLIVVSYLVDTSGQDVASRRSSQSHNTWRRRRRSNSSILAVPPDDKDAIITDRKGNPIENAAGIITFEVETMEVSVGREEKKCTVPIFRKNGTQGAVTCKYCMEPLSAVPGYDYVDAEGEVTFEAEQSRQEVGFTLLPKRGGEKTHAFQIVLNSAHGGVFFNPNHDGGTERCLLTVNILNGAKDSTISNKALSVIDGVFNLNSVRMGNAAWYEGIKEAIFSPSDDEDSKPSVSDWIIHILCMPWKVSMTLAVPPPYYLGGWLCFICSLGAIGVLTALIIDFAELFACVLKIDEFVTAVTFVALGTSMPDLLASRQAALNDDWADASIVNVTGSNSVNVFLGIGIPWTMAAVYWKIVGATPDWIKKYGTPPAGKGAYFVVRGNDLAFSVVVFSIAALLALGIIRLRRIKLGGELGGPFRVKIMSCLILVLLWVFFIILVVWKSFSAAPLSSQMFALLVGICIFENTVMILSFVFYAAMDCIPESKKLKSADSIHQPCEEHGVQVASSPDLTMTQARGPRDPSPEQPKPPALPCPSALIPP